MEASRKTADTSDEAREARAAVARATAACAAVDRLSGVGLIGLGSGRAVNAVIAAAGERWPIGPPPLAVCASRATEERARDAGFVVVDLDELAARPARGGPSDWADRRSRRTGARAAGKAAARSADKAATTTAARNAAGSGASFAHPLLELLVDGADEVDPHLDMLKGGGGALLRERLVARAAARRLIVVEDDKLVGALGADHRLPVEVVRFAWRQTREQVLELLPAAELRRGDEGRAFVTDEGHYLLDCELPDVGGGERLAALAAALKSLPGVVDHGLFLGLADEVLVGHADGSIDTLQRS